MNLIPKKNFLFVLACILVVALGYMAVKTNIFKNEPAMTEEQMMIKNDEMEMDEIKTQSDSDDIESIENDLNGTDLSGIDKDLDDLSKELITQ